MRVSKKLLRICCVVLAVSSLLMCFGCSAENDKGSSQSAAVTTTVQTTVPDTTAQPKKQTLEEAVFDVLTEQSSSNLTTYCSVFDFSVLKQEEENGTAKVWAQVVSGEYSNNGSFKQESGMAGQFLYVFDVSKDGVYTLKESKQLDPKAGDVLPEDAQAALDKLDTEAMQKKCEQKAKEYFNK